MIRLLIDGYNLLFLWRGKRPGATASDSWLRTERIILLNTLSKQLPSDIRVKTTIVFDSRRSDSQIEEASQKYPMHILYATQHDSADDLIIELIRKHSAPSSLLVVSSDRYIQQAANRRKAHVLSSLVFMEQCESGKFGWCPSDGASETQPQNAEALTKSAADGTPQSWMEYFGFEGDATSNHAATTPVPSDDLSHSRKQLIDGFTPSQDPLTAGRKLPTGDTNTIEKKSDKKSIDFRKRARRQLPPGDIFFHDSDPVD